MKPAWPFDEFFHRATGGQTPYPYQTRFATAENVPHLLRVPTGAGKTAAAVLGWLWRWRHGGFPTPRRLVYCLPMRVLVEQSERAARRWIERLDLANEVNIHVLMGGVDSAAWYLYPERPAILIGTQDMLLSRALNRGYAASRFHWPIDFALLNNDCLWVFDEPQLMASGVSTSAQLAGLRQSLGTFGKCPSVWMSATLEPDWLETIDFRCRSGSEKLGPSSEATAGPIELSDEDYDPRRPLFQRMTAAKTLAPLCVPSSRDMKDVAKMILGSGERTGIHQPNSQTLVIVNTVERAKAVYDELQKLRKKSPTPSLLLIHSRFRPVERQQLSEALQKLEIDRIIVATQVVEAGVDISARTVVTELAPWSSLVQRMGRCNRTGCDGPGHVYWIDLDEKLSPPYSPADLDFSREQLEKLDGQSVSPRNLDCFKAKGNITLPFEHKHVLRRRDLLDLFDTTPDLSGNDIDIQRFVRGDDPEGDVQIFWRAIGNDVPTADEPAPLRDELCNVPIGQARDFFKSRVEKKRGAGYVWDHLEEQWIKLDPKQVRPGLTILLPSGVGGYDWNEETKSGKGWDVGSDSSVAVLPHGETLEESAGSDTYSALVGPWLTIAQHTANVCRELAALLAPLDLDNELQRQLAQAARWHDLGKAHWAFQKGMLTANPSLTTDQQWAKSGVKRRLRHGRKHFRHELASALAAQQRELPFAVAYIIASHHGRARLAIRSLPGEDEPTTPETLFALGVHHGDALPEVDLGDETCPALTLDLTPMLLGGERSWTASALRLLAELGPFRLAYLESLLRAADIRASEKEASNAWN